MSKQVRFSWSRNASTQVVVKTDKTTSRKMAIELSEFPESIQDECTVYGLTKILDDRTSQVDAADKMAAQELLVEQFKTGVWIGPRTGGLHQVSPIIEVIMAAKGCSVSAAQKAWGALDKVQKEALKLAQAEAIADVIETRQLAEDEEISLDDLS